MIRKLRTPNSHSFPVVVSIYTVTYRVIVKFKIVTYGRFPKGELICTTQNWLVKKFTTKK